MKILMILGCILIAVGTVGAWQTQAPVYTAPVLPPVLAPSDVANMGTANLNIVAGISSRDQLVLSHDQRIWNLEQQVAQLQAQITALQGNTGSAACTVPQSLSNPVFSGNAVVSGNLITQTNTGTTANWAFNCPAGAHTVTVTGAGPGTLTLLINGAPQGGVVLKFPASTFTPPDTVSFVWPGGQGNLGFQWSGWVNVQTTLTVQ